MIKSTFFKCYKYNFYINNKITLHNTINNIAEKHDMSNIMSLTFNILLYHEYTNVVCGNYV